MIEEFIQGESLDTFVSGQKSISQELIIKFGIQLCDILDYLHHLSPYPILYQDLKPEHIILCGNQLKLIDFGVASFFTGSGKHFQYYGTDGFVSPEALEGLPTSPAADIYGLGKILEFLAKAAEPRCSVHLQRIIKRAAAADLSERYQTAASMKSALLGAQTQPYRHSSHLIRNIAVIGSRPGSGATHFAVSLVSTLGKKAIPALYVPADGRNTLNAIAQANRCLKEQDGIFYYCYFKGVPDYGDGVSFPLPEGNCIVKDYGVHPVSLLTLESMDMIFFILNGGDWDITSSLAFGKHLCMLPQTVLICNHTDKKAAQNYAGALGRRVYCFPNDPDPYRVTAEKERLFSAILHLKGGNRHIWF